MDPLSHSDSRGIIEGILRYIPGFRGYLEKEYRRESDGLARKALEDSLQHVKQNVDRYLAAQVDQGKLETLAVGERLKSRIDQLQNKIRSSVRGYSAFFEYVKVNRARLDDVLALDLQLVSACKSIEEAAEILSGEKETLVDKLEELGSTVDELSKKFAQRSDILTGLSD